MGGTLGKDVVSKNLSQFYPKSHPTTLIRN